MSYCSQPMRLGCWNVNSLRARWSLVESWLDREKIDMALFQETKITDDLFPEKCFQDRGYHAAFWGQKSYNGVAIISRWPLSDVQRHDFNSTGQARYIQAMTGGLRLACVYVPQGQDFDKPAYLEKLQFLQGLSDHIAAYRMDHHPTIIGGDYNIAPSDADIYNPMLWHHRVMCSVPERQAFRRMIYAGWCEAEITRRGCANPHTWWPYQQGAWAKKQGLRIDSFLLSPDAADSVRGTGVSDSWRDEVPTSDHAPLWLDLDRLDSGP